MLSYCWGDGTDASGLDGGLSGYRCCGSHGSTRRKTFPNGLSGRRSASITRVVWLVSRAAELLSWRRDCAIPHFEPTRRQAFLKQFRLSDPITCDRLVNTSKPSGPIDEHETGTSGLDLKCKRTLCRRTQVQTQTNSGATHVEGISIRKANSAAMKWSAGLPRCPLRKARGNCGSKMRNSTSPTTRSQKNTNSSTEPSSRTRWTVCLFIRDTPRRYMV